MELPYLDKWVRYHDALVGEAYFHPEFKNGQRVITNHVGRITGNIAFCAGNETWRLGTPTEIEYHMEKKPVPLTRKIFVQFAKKL